MPSARWFVLSAVIGVCVGKSTAISADSDVGPVGVHPFLREAHRAAPVSADLLERRNEPLIPLQPRDAVSSPTATIFGFLPYWSSASYLRYDLLTHLACFSVEVNSDGSLGNDHGWPWTGVINDAHQNGVKVILVATLFNAEDIFALITDPVSMNSFFVNIKNKMVEGGADGLNIDFEGSGTAWKAHINSFMSDLTAYLHAELPSSEVTIDGPAVNWSNAWDLVGLAASCDGIFIMGYNFYGSWSSNTGPVAPLAGGSINITDTVENQYGAVVQSSPEKLILGVPYYGAHWETAGPEAHALVIGWVGSVRFSTAQPESESYGRLWDAESQTPWSRWHDGSSWHQVWFDDASSVGLKYDLAVANDLQGVGMWALGYDGARSELWQVVEEKFGEGVSGPIPTVSGWGLITLGLIVLTAGTLVVIRRRLPTAA